MIDGPLKTQENYGLKSWRHLLALAASIFVDDGFTVFS